MNTSALLNTLASRAYSLPLVILYVTSGCNLRCITCSFREPLPDELSLDEYRHLAASLQRLGLRHVVFSGGEPLVRRDFPAICRIFQSLKIKQSLLTNGLLLEKRLDDVIDFFDEIIVSLDGPSPEIHNAIRGLDCFDQIVKGVKTILLRTPHPLVSFRMVVQRRNFRFLERMVTFSRELGINHVSFLAADVLSGAFNRDQAGPMASKEEIMLTADETKEFRSIIREMVGSSQRDFQSGFIAESPSKMMHLVEYFEAFHRISPFPRNFCNAPMVSAVITSTGELLPCYFLPSYGNIRSGKIADLLNNDQIRRTRKNVRSYSLEQCQRCVCTLRVSPTAALFDRF